MIQTLFMPKIEFIAFSIVVQTTDQFRSLKIRQNPQINFFKEELSWHQPLVKPVFTGGSAEAD